MKLIVNGIPMEVEDGVNALDLSGNISKELKKEALVARLNDRVISLVEPIHEDGVLEILNFSDEDAKRKEEIEARNNCDSLVNATETTLNELGDQVPADSKSTVDAAIAAAKTALEGTDVDAIKAATEKLQQASYKLAEVAYSNQDAAAAGAGAAGAAPQQDDGPIEADYEVVDDKNEGK